MMPVETVFAFAAIVTLLVAAPGPNLFLLLRSTPAQGRAAGLLMVAGMGAAIVCHAMLSVIGLSAIVLASAKLFEAVKWIGAGYLIWLGIQSLRKGLQPPGTIDAGAAATGPTGMAGAFVQGWLANILNPAPALFYLAIVPQFLIPAGPQGMLGQAVLLAAVHAAIALIWYGLIVVGIERAGAWLRKPVIQRRLQTLSGLALVAFGIRTAVGRS